MKSRRNRGLSLATLGLGLFLSATTCFADGRPGAIEVSPFVGPYYFDSDLKLDHDFAFGLRLGYWLTDRWEAELSAEGLRAGERQTDGWGSLFESHADVLYHFKPAPGVQPYLAAGVGAAKYNSRAHDGWDPLVNYGAGVKLWVTDSVGLRFDVRQPVTFGSIERNLMWNVGVSFLFGGARPAPAPAAPADSDGDGVPDPSDACPGTPAGVKVDAKGCPLDSDGDGVPDYLDKCPGTPRGAPVDSSGCPLDSDGDGVFDYLDKCPGTPRGTKVDSVGCPLPAPAPTPSPAPAAAPRATLSVQPQSIEQGQAATLSWSTQDATEVSIDGVGKVDPRGSRSVSPRETTTYRLSAAGPGGRQEATTTLQVAPPKRPTATLSASPAQIKAGETSTLTWKTENAEEARIEGIGSVQPQGSRAVRPDTSTTYRLTVRGPGGTAEATTSVGVTPAAPAQTIELTVNFDFDSDVVKPRYFPEVERVARFMKENPKTTVIIEGHTDSVGPEEYNLKLSTRRANSIAKLLTSQHGIALERITAQSLGETKPVADNKTREGRAKNRRIYAHSESE